jgi:hypothetical protein
MTGPGWRQFWPSNRCTKRSCGTTKLSKPKSKIVSKDDGLKGAREQAEQRTADALRQAVAMLEFAITELNEHSPPKASFRHAVKPLNIINAIHDLKTKCGVAFEHGSSSEFEHHIKLDQVHLNEPPQDTEADRAFRELTKEVNRKAREKQVAQYARLKTMREAAQRLAARAKQQAKAAKLAQVSQSFQDSASAPAPVTDENS